MELILSEHDYDSNALNNKLSSWNRYYRFFSESVHIKEQKKFIGSLYRSDTLILRFEYAIVGSYNKSKNMWIWASLSLTLDKPLIDEVLKIRKLGNQHRVKFTDLTNLIDQDYSIVPTQDVVKFISTLSLILFDEANQQIITLQADDDKIDVYVVKRILFENI